MEPTPTTVPSQDEQVTQMKPFCIRLDEETRAGLQKVAQTLRVKPTQLAREWIEERLELEIAAGVLAAKSDQLPGEVELGIRRRVIEVALGSVAEIAERIFLEVVEDVVQEALADHDADAMSEAAG